jgi:hypothetical protein
MAKVLTKAATVTCDDKPPGTPAGGPLTLTSAAREFFKVAGNAVLAQTLQGASIGTGCARSSSNLTPCSTASTQSAGLSTVLTVDGKPALLDSSKGTTDQSTWSVSLAGQDMLTAV